MPTLLYQCPAGLSGDMNLGAMIALGVDPAQLIAELQKLPYSGWSLHFEQDQRQGISGIRCDVRLDSASVHQDPLNSVQSLLPDTSPHNLIEHPKQDHGHRHYCDIRDAIIASELNPRVKHDAIACFQALANAEGAVHGIEPEAVHFHEVGAIDSIIDIVGAAICWDLLNIDRVICSTLEVGGGMVQCAHGLMPVPAPATARLLQGKPFTSGGTNKEATTPTGATLLIGKQAEFSATSSGIQLKAAIGIGQRNDAKLANAVYVSLIDESTNASSYEHDQIIELATNIDDMSAEAISYLSEQLLAGCALDVWQTSATFKKGRLGVVLHVLATATAVDHLETILFTHSRTLGIRRQTWQRNKLKRTLITLNTQWGPVHVKQAAGPNELTRHKFEYEDCARIAESTGQSIAAVKSILESDYAKHIGQPHEH